MNKLSGPPKPAVKMRCKLFLFRQPSARFGSRRSKNVEQPGIGLSGLGWRSCLPLRAFPSGGPSAAARGIRYATLPVTIGPIARSISAIGTVNPELTIIVGTYVSGVIQELSCDYNT